MKSKTDGTGEKSFVICKVLQCGLMDGDYGEDEI